MAKVLKYTVARKIDWVHVKDDVYAFREEVYRGNKLLDENEGLATLEVLEKLKNHEPIKRFKKSMLNA